MVQCVCTRLTVHLCMCLQVGGGGGSVSLLINLKRGVFKYNWRGGGVVGNDFLRVGTMFVRTRRQFIAREIEVIELFRC